MKNSIRALKTSFFIFLLALLPLQVFADEKGAPHPHADERIELEDETSGDNGHGEAGHEDESHGDDGVHGEGDDLEHGQEVDGHGEAEHEDESHGDDGHGQDGGHGEADILEEGPNYPVLGSFAAINGGFLLFGAIRKISSNKRKSGVK